MQRVIFVTDRRNNERRGENLLTLVASFLLYSMIHQCSKHSCLMLENFCDSMGKQGKFSQFLVAAGEFQSHTFFCFRRLSIVLVFWS